MSNTIMRKALKRLLKTVSVILAVAIAMVLPNTVLAQDFSTPFKGMRDSNAPIQIDSDRLEVWDREGIALFSGNVSAIQGETILKAARLKVIYVKGSGSPGGNVKYLEATGKIAVRSSDHTVTADRGEFYMLKQTIRLSGDVVISQGGNVASGCILEISLKSGSATLKPCRKQGRPTIIFNTKKASGK